MDDEIMLISVDVGGTFTDVVAIENGRVKTKKVPTTPEAREKGVLEGFSCLGVKDKKIFNHATTAGLNAILTRDLPRIGFLTTMGHRDILDIGRCWRPWDAQTDPYWRRSFGDAMRPLVSRYLRRGIIERTLSNGKILIDLDIAQARNEIQILKRQNIKGLAICLINAYVNDKHERTLRDIANEILGDIPISISSDVSPLAKEYARASTTVVDVFMKLVLGKYLNNLFHGAERLGFRGRTHLADCAATLIPWKYSMDKPFRNIFGGPAAGTVASAYFGKLINENKLICCDIGGTSCDISVVRDGRPTVHTEFEIEHDLIVNTLAIEVYSVGSGGGSKVYITPTGQLKVGPESAGANPGPACYKRGGNDLTVTDLCLLIGIIDPSNFLGGGMPLYPDLATGAVKRIDIKLNYEEKIRYAYSLNLHNLSESLLNVSLSSGIDPRDFSVIAYGSAGPMLIPSIMGELRVKSVIVPPNPGNFCALGLLSSDLVFVNERTAYMVLTPDISEKINRMFEELEEEILTQIPNSENVKIKRTFDGMYMGQSWSTALVSVPPGKIEANTIEQMIANFNAEYEKRAGNRFDYLPVMGVNYRVQIFVDLPKIEYAEIPKRLGKNKGAKTKRKLSFLKDVKGNEIEVNEYKREYLQHEDTIKGPAIIREPMSTTFILEGQKAIVGKYGEIYIVMG